jgi:hypothetical protein
MISKKIVLKLTVSILIFIICGELFSYVYYFHKNSRSNFGWEKIVNKFDYLLFQKKNLSFQLKNENIGSEIIWTSLYDEEEDFLQFLKSEYRKKFNAFHQLCKEQEAEMLFVYVPQTKPNSYYSPSEKICRTFFKNIAEENNCTYLDLTSKFRNFNYDHITLSPEDSHLCRYGNYLLAEEVSKFLNSRPSAFSQNNKNPQSYPRDLGNFGDWSGTYKKSYYNYSRYHININNIGIRGNHDLITPKSKCRAVCIGDSFTFGHGVLNEHTYPHILGNLNTKFEILNFGIPGTSIVSQFMMLKNSKNLQIDYVILQVGDNDLMDLMTHHQEIFSVVKPVARTLQETTF